MATLQRLICIAGLVLLAVGSATAAASATAPPSVVEHNKKVMLGVRLTMKPNTLRDCPKQPEATEQLSKYVGETLLHLLETAGIKGLVKSGIIKCTSDAGDAGDAESYGQRVRFTFAASIESKAAGALHALLEQVQQLEHNGLSVCHVMGADCWRANVAKFELKAAEKLSKGVKLHKASKPYIDSSSSSGAGPGEEDGDAGGEYATSHRGPKRHHKGGSKHEAIVEKKHGKRDAIHEAKQHKFERKAAKWQHKREKHGHFAGGSSGDSRAPQEYDEPAVVTLSSQQPQVALPAPFAGRYALTPAMPAAARLAAPQFQLAGASTQTVYVLPQQLQQQQQQQQVPKPQPAVAAAVAAVPQGAEAYSWPSDPDVIITEEALTTGVSASNEQR